MGLTVNVGAVNTTGKIDCYNLIIFFKKIHTIHIEYCKSDAILISNEALVETSSVVITSSASQPSLTTVIEQTATACETEFWVCNLKDSFHHKPFTFAHKKKNIYP